jgi:hypothetical protein
MLNTINRISVNVKTIFFIYYPNYYWNYADLL